ncbi:MAG: Maf family protein [Halothermotrichaceae bacterium]
MSKLVLASMSPRRQELMKRMGFNFTVVPSKIDEEKYIDLSPVEMVQQLAEAKALEVAGLVEDTVVIAADTIVLYNGKILGKPQDQQQAFKTLKKLQGDKHTVITGISVCNTDNKIVTDYDQTEVFMRSISEKEIRGYVTTGEPMDKAGAYGIQGLGGIFVERIKGSYFTVMGLPIHKLVLMLKKFEVEVF